MGIGHWSHSSFDKVVYVDRPVPVQGNPNPSNYELLKIEQIGKFLLIKIRYPDCSNYEGVKILVFKNVELTALINQHNIDPHFSDSKKHHHPIVRFVPTDEGWEMAKKFINMEVNNEQNGIQ